METARTVTGDVPLSDLGITLPHEHLIFDLSNKLIADDKTLPGRNGDRSAIESRRMRAEMTMENLWWMRSFPQPTSSAATNYRVSDVDLIVEETQRFADRGGGTIVDPTAFRMGRDPHALRTIVNRTGLNVIAGTGYYLPSSYPSDMAEKSAEDIAADIISDVENGIDGTRIRAGVIGEIGATAGYANHPVEQTSFRGAAIAQQKTDAPITVHPPYFFQEGHDILDTLEDAGADLENVIMGHMDGTIRDDDALEYHRSIANRGPFLEFDVFGRSGYRPSFDSSWPLDGDRIRHISRLLDNYADQILISQDVCAKTHLTRYGGFGYDYILRAIVPRLEKRGFSKSQIDQILIHNPADAIAFSG